MRVFEKMMLRQIFGHMEEKVTGDKKKLHNVELHNVCYLPYSNR
jgi:hypothetical protein